MAAKSKRMTNLARIKRERNQLKKLLIQTVQLQGRATALVLGMLVQAGGEITFSIETTTRMSADMSRMGYKIEPDEQGLVRVKLVMQDAPSAPEVERGQIVLTD